MGETQRFSPEMASDEADKMSKLLENEVVDAYPEAELLIDEKVTSPENAKAYYYNLIIKNQDAKMLEILSSMPAKTESDHALENQIKADLSLRETNLIELEAKHE